MQFVQWQIEEYWSYYIRKLVKTLIKILLIHLFLIGLGILIRLLKLTALFFNVLQVRELFLYNSSHKTQISKTYKQNLINKLYRTATFSTNIFYCRQLFTYFSNLFLVLQGIWSDKSAFDQYRNILFISISFP